MLGTRSHVMPAKRVKHLKKRFEELEDIITKLIA